MTSTNFNYLPVRPDLIMKTFVILLFLAISNLCVAQTKALVGGTLVDGFGGTPIQNSIIIIEGKRIVAVGEMGKTPIPSGAEIISTEGMTV